MLEVIGDRGYIRVANPSWEGLGPIKVTSWMNGMPGPKAAYYRSSAQWENEIGSFAQSIETGTLVPDAASAEDAFKVDYIVSRMRLSDENGGTVVTVDK
jgi:hypothetical protein